MRRRHFLSIMAMGIGIGVGAGAGVLAGKGRGLLRRASRDRSDGDALPVETTVPELFRSLGAAEDGRVERWRVVAVHPVRMGAVSLVMAPVDAASSGERFQLDVLRRDAAAPAGVGESRSLAVYVANRGDGETRTHEEHGLAAMALARALDRREAAGVPVPALLSLREREARFPVGAFHIAG